MARPSKFTEELVTAICERLSVGEPLAQICRDEGFPHPSTVRDWMAAREEVSLAIARAREDGFDQIAMEAMRIADTPLEGVSEKYEQVTIDNPDDPELPKVEEFRLTERKVEDMLGHRKLQIETRLKLLAKWDPKRYGDKQAIEHSGPGGKPIQQEVVRPQLTRDEWVKAHVGTPAGAAASGD